MAAGSTPATKPGGAVTDFPTERVADQFAALDLGSNSFHLIVASHRTGRIQVIDKLKEMVRLADGLNEKGKLSPEVTQRAIDCLQRFGQRLRPLPRDHVRVVGTSTLRRAKNGAEFLSAAEAALGHDIEIISGIEEARLIYLGVAFDLARGGERRLVIDIGGGSTEVIAGHGDEPEIANSLHMGCVNMTQRFFSDGQLSRANFDAAISFAQQELEPVQALYLQAGWDRAIGASGSILAAAQVVAEQRSNGTALDQGIEAAELDQLVERLVDIGRIDALRLAGLNQERAPVFAGGVAILTGLVRGLGIDTLITSQGALREGLLVDLLGRSDEHDVRDETVAELVNRFQIDEHQANRVQALALELLAQVSDDWALNDEANPRKLGWAALLHELGLSLAHGSFHKHGAYLLANMDLPGFSQAEQQGLALLVRAHRRKFPKLEFHPKDPRSLRLLRLAVLLRLAALFHRSRTGELPPKVELEAKGEALRLTLDRAWLAEHPLTRLDLEQEADYLKACQLDLTLDER